MEHAVEIRGVSRTYGDFRAVDDVSLLVSRGEFLCIIGPSGCGKTTLLRMIAGFAEPSDGDILVDGRSVVGVPPHRRPVNMVFQHYALFPQHDGRTERRLRARDAQGGSRGAVTDSPPRCWRWWNCRASRSGVSTS